MQVIPVRVRAPPSFLHRSFITPLKFPRSNLLFRENQELEKERGAISSLGKPRSWEAGASCNLPRG